MRYEELRERWQAALSAAKMMAYFDRPQETIDLATTTRRWQVHLLPDAVPPFHVGATIGFRWSPFESARSYTTEDDLLRDVFGHEARRATRRRLVRIDLELGAALPWGATAALPAADLWQRWNASTMESLDRALRDPRRRMSPDITDWIGEVEIVGTTSPQGSFALHRLSVPAFELLEVPRLWDDEIRREKEASAAAARIERLAGRFRKALDAWTASIRELAGSVRCEPDPDAPASRQGSEWRALYDDPGPDWIN